MTNLSQLVNRNDRKYYFGYRFFHSSEFISAHHKKENFERIFRNFGGKPIKADEVNNYGNSDNFSVGVFCDRAEELCAVTLNPYSEYYRRGCVLLVDNIPVGHVKLKGDRTFLAWKNIENSSNEVPIIFGGMYSISFDLVSKINNQTLREDGNWNYLNLDSLSLRPGRLAEEKFFKMKTLRQRIREESARFEDYLFSRCAKP